MKNLFQLEVKEKISPLSNSEQSLIGFVGLNKHRFCAQYKNGGKEEKILVKIPSFYIRYCRKTICGSVNENKGER